MIYRWCNHTDPRQCMTVRYIKGQVGSNTLQLTAKTPTLLLLLKATACDLNKVDKQAQIYSIIVGN